MTGFVHLRVHTEYSLVDSVVRVDPLVDALDKLGMPACAITDQGNVSALVKFYRAAFDRGIKPLIGADVWVAESADDREPTRLTLLCQNRLGFKRLSALLTRSAAGGSVAGRNVVLKDWLTVGALEGLIGLSGAQAGELGRALEAGRDARAPEVLDYWRTLLPQRFYVELQRLGRPGRERVSRPRGRARRGEGRARGRDERRLLPRSRRLRGARDARLYRPRRDARRSVARPPVLRGAVPEVRAGDGRRCSPICPRRSRTRSRSRSVAASSSISAACSCPTSPRTTAAHRART